jgi:hypothetical protein
MAKPSYEIFHIEEREGKENYFRPVGAIWEGETQGGRRKLSLQLDVIPVHGFTGKLIALEREEEKAAANL